MVKSEIRLIYPRFIVFASRLLSVATGLAFVLMITRSISTEDFEMGSVVTAQTLPETTGIFQLNLLVRG